MTLASHARSSFALLAVFALAACGGSQPEAQPQTQSFASEVPAPTTPAPIPSDTSAAPVPSAMPQSTMGDAKGNSGNSGVAAQETLTDAQIAMIVTTADKGEIDQAKLAQKNAKDAKVKQFAAHMITDHGKDLADAQKLAKKLGITPESSSVSQKLETDGQSILSRLQNEKGADFDRDYIDAQVDEHQQVVDLMNQKLIPQAKNAELKQAIQMFLPKVEHHLADAKSIQAALPQKSASR